MGVKAVLIDTTTGSVLKHADYPRLDMTPFPDGELQPGLKWLIKYQPFLQPDYDSRYFILVSDDAITEIEHPDYVGLDYYKIGWKVEKRATEDIVRSLEDIETIKNQEVFSTNEHIETLTRVINAILRTEKKLELTVDELALKDRINDIAVKFDKNKDTKKVKKALIENGEEPDLETGWEPPVV